MAVDAEAKGTKMSLTGELNRGDSWANGFFKQRFPGLVGFVKREGTMVRSLETRVPSQSTGSARLVGTAFDYRLRMLFEPDFEDSDVLRTGIKVLLWAGSGLGEAADTKWATAMVALLREVPTGDPDLQARVSVVLAWLDSGYRAGIWDPGLRAVATAIGTGEAVDWNGCTAGVDGSIAIEVADIMRLVDPPAADSVVCGPSFDGSAFVGGADADLIVDGCLYDVKTTMKPRRGLPRSVRQLLGYALLDWNDALAGIGGVLFLAPRNVALVGTRRHGGADRRAGGNAGTTPRGVLLAGSRTQSGSGARSGLRAYSGKDCRIGSAGRQRTPPKLPPECGYSRTGRCGGTWRRGRQRNPALAGRLHALGGYRPDRFVGVARRVQGEGHHIPSGHLDRGWGRPPSTKHGDLTAGGHSAQGTASRSVSLGGETKAWVNKTTHTPA